MNKEELLNYIEMNGGVINANKNPYLQVSNSFIRNPEYNVNEKMVFEVLGTYAGASTSCFPSKETIAKHLKISVKTVERTINELKKKQALIVINRKWETNGKTSNMYILADIDWTTGMFKSESLNDYISLVGEVVTVKSPKKNK